MAKRSGRDRDRDAARKGSRDETRAGRANRRLARELGKLGKQLDRARSNETKRLRQLDEAAAEVVRLEAELRRLEAEIAGATAGRPAAAAPSAPSVDLTAHAAGLEAELARLESAPVAGLPHEVAPPDEVAAAEAPAGWPQPALAGEDSPLMDGEVAEPGIDAEALLRTEAPAEAGGEAAPTEATGVPDEVPAVAGEAGGPAPAEEPWAEPWAESPDIEAPDEWPEVIHLGAGAGGLETGSDAAIAPLSIESDEDRGVAEAPWTAGAGLPFRPERRNGGAAADSPASPETARHEAAEAPEPTARSWPQRSRDRAGR